MDKMREDNEKQLEGAGKECERKLATIEAEYKKWLIDNEHLLETNYRYAWDIEFMKGEVW